MLVPLMLVSRAKWSQGLAGIDSPGPCLGPETRSQASESPAAPTAFQGGRMRRATPLEPPASPGARQRWTSEADTSATRSMPLGRLMGTAQSPSGCPAPTLRLEQCQLGGPNSLIPFWPSLAHPPPPAAGCVSRGVTQHRGNSGLCTPGPGLPLLPPLPHRAHSWEWC